MFQVFPLFMYSKITLLTLERTKRSYAFKGILVFFTWVFCVIKRFMRVFWYFCFFNCLIQKLLACVPHALRVDGACDAARWSNLAICRLPRCAGVLSSTWCGACRLIMVRLSLIINFFSFFLSFLSPDH